MHEHSLVRALLAQVERLAGAEGAGQVEEIRVKVGPLSGVEPLLLDTAFQILAPRTSLGKARLVVEEVPLVAQCADCGHEFKVPRFRFRCPVCDCRKVEVTAGDGFILETITLHRSVTTGARA